MNLSRPLRARLNFATLHYAYIIFMGVLSLAIVYPAGNLKAVDAYFFGASASTESGLNTVDIKDLYTYQQLYIYFTPLLTNLGFINAIVVLVRFLWFREHLTRIAPRLIHARQRQAVHGPRNTDVEAGQDGNDHPGDETKQTTEGSRDEPAVPVADKTRAISFDPSVDHHPKDNETLYVPGPRDRDRGHPIVELDKVRRDSQDDMSIAEAPQPGLSDGSGLRRRHPDNLPFRETKTISRVASAASSAFVIGAESANRPRNSITPSATMQRDATTRDMLALSPQVTIGRNSEFSNLTSRDREKLGGIEYRSLRLLLKIVFGYYFGLHLLGVICLIGWIQYADPKYKEVLKEAGQDLNFWAFYSAQTMVDNLGMTLTPDSMISFRDAQWPMFIMSFLAFAGNTLYPAFLRLIIWTTSKLAPKRSSIQEPLSFLLNHPRRCYTLLFPASTTWILFAIIFILNFVDTLLIIVLDLENPEVASIPLGPRILAAIFQAASSRHTGTATFNLANVNPAVQFSLLVMMYIAIYPIAISMRASNTLEEKSLGIYRQDGVLDESNGKGYFLTHLQNQLSFDLWYIFLGTFCICIAESGKIADPSKTPFSVWSVFFEVTSAYGNVGLSLGYPEGLTSLSGVFSTFSKLVICAMMIRGRHRGLPYALDRAIMLPEERLLPEESQENGRSE